MKTKQQLQKELDQHNYMYYIGKPIINDTEYDILLKCYQEHYGTYEKKLTLVVL